MDASFIRSTSYIAAQIKAYDPEHPEHTMLLSGDTVHQLRDSCAVYSVNELKDIHKQLGDWLTTQNSEFDIPIGYRDFHAKLGQVVADFVAEYLLPNEDTEDE